MSNYMEGCALRRGRKKTHGGFGNIIQHENKQTKKKVKAGKKSRGIFKSIVYSVFVCIFVFMIACLGIGAGMYAAITQEIEDMNVENLALTRSSKVYYTDKDGNSREAATLFGDGNCIWVNSDKISQYAKDAIVSIEDERFYNHNGVDLKRTAGAVVSYALEKIGKGRATYGGSTITQQVVKNITQEKSRTATRKIKEMMRAVALEKQLSKDEILTIYLNIVFFGNNSYGIEAASNMYFNKNAEDLTLSEAALIAGITNRPSYYDPIAHPDYAIERRNVILKKMYDLGRINEEQYNEASASDIGLSGTHKAYKSKIYSYFVDTVINEVIRDLQKEKGYTEDFTKQLVFGSGLKIYTTMDYDIQKTVESVFEDSSNFRGGAKNAQSAMVIIDPKTGEIKGIVGGKGEKVDSRGLNRATQSTRQPGSSIKPLSVYTPAIEKGVVSPSTKVVDEPITIGEWEPKNAYKGFKGSMTVKKAVEISANIPAIKVLQKVGLNTSYDYAKNKFHLSTIVDADKDLSPLALGGLTNGVTVKDMAAAYAVFANDGYYIPPHTYTKVLDSANRVLLEHDSEKEKERVIKSSTAYVMSDILYNVVNGSGGTGKLAKLSSAPTYGKTGTTNNDYDKWFVGYTSNYVGAVWFGFDTQASIRKAGITENISARLWNKVMEPIHSKIASAEIQPSEDLVQAYVCTSSGLLASSSC
ncbi:MAG: PBP1A family penicillin-binding protein, partial [Clostridia bacterium]|nr:PBP1A family penicillin-binding protein [Clostridia bacterium]